MSEEPYAEAGMHLYRALQIVTKQIEQAPSTEVHWLKLSRESIASALKWLRNAEYEIDPRAI